MIRTDTMGATDSWHAWFAGGAGWKVALTEREVGGLPDAEAVAEARVVAPREGDHELARVLDDPAHVDACMTTCPL